MAAGVVHIPWYATVFRGDKFEAALLRDRAASRCATARRSGRSTARSDDKYKFLQLATFEDKADFERYWYGAEFSTGAASYSSWYQVPGALRLARPRRPRRPRGPRGGRGLSRAAQPTCGPLSCARKEAISVTAAVMYAASAHAISSARSA